MENSGFDFLSGASPAFLSIWEHVTGVECDDYYTSPQNDTFSAEEYLKKGERILSLVREIPPRFRATNMRTLLEYINCSTMLGKPVAGARMKYFETRVNAAIRQACENVLAQEGSESAMEDKRQFDYSELLSLIPDFLRESIQIEDVYEGYGFDMIKAIFYKVDNPHVVHVKVGSRFDGYMSVSHKLPKSKHGKKYRFRSERNNREAGIRIYDAAMLFNSLVQLGVICEYVKSIEDIDRTEDSICHILASMYQKSEKVAMTDTGVLRIDKEVTEIDWYVDYLTDINQPYMISDDSRRIGKVDLVALQLLNKLPIDCDIAVSNTFLFCNVIISVVDAYVQEQRTRSYLEGTKSHADAFTTKKQINKNVLEAMMKSSFNDTFGYVEFDNDVDLKLVGEIEKEFKAINTLLHIEKNENTSLRFRKLGNYKASGLYHPYYQCLCVDIRTPSSMVHELFHMIDYDHKQLSKNASFDAIEALYMKLVEDTVNQMDKGSLFRKQWYGKSKFNRAYYAEPTEIFARCGEIYIARICEVRNSLCVPDQELTCVYPDNEELNDLIDTYYSKLLNKEEPQQDTLRSVC